MKDFRQRLLDLLSRCADDQNESKKLQYLASITQSDDYKELQDNIAWVTEFKATYSVEELETLNAAELKKRKNAIQNISKLFRLLQGSIYFGNAPSLTPEDIPVFSDARSIVRLSEKLKVTDKRKNYSNIDAKDSMRIFDTTTIRSAQTCFDMLPLSLAKSSAITENEINTVLGNQLYCIDAVKFQEVHKHFLGFSSKAEEALSKEKNRRNNYRLLKIAIVMIVWGVLFALNQFGMFTPTTLSQTSVWLFLLSIAFLILG